MDDATKQAVNSMINFANKCSGPTGSEFAAFQNCVNSLITTIDTQAEKIKKLEAAAATPKEDGEKTDDN